MRINYLRLKNFKPIFVVMDKTEILLDYRPLHNKVINIFVGPMGSCKTFLLGHHQPFATLGTLDSRNMDDMILDGKTGEKEICYSTGHDEYLILHRYLPTKSGGHSVKSYIKKNGIELNENGNSTSFKQIIDIEFGLDQNYLKLFRIGSNVTNLPDMTSTERKSFISSMLSETEIYSFLYKRIGEENRSLTAQLTILVNRLHSISNQTEEELSKEYDTEMEITKEIKKKIDSCVKSQYHLEGTMTSMMEGQPIEQYRAIFSGKKEEMDRIQTRLKEIQEELDEAAKYPNIQDLSRAIGQLHGQIDIRNTQIHQLQMSLDEVEDELRKLQENAAVLASPDHIQTLRQTYNSLMATLNENNRRLKNFHYDGSMASITSLMGDIETVNQLIMEVSGFNLDAVKKIISNPKGALHFAQRTLDKLEADRSRVQQEMTNIKQVVLYKATHVMVRPFNCPTEDCPFYKYHPATEQKLASKKNGDEAFLEKRNKLRNIEAKMYLYEDYPNMARKISTLKHLWDNIIPRVQDVGVLREDSLLEVITNLMKRGWYDEDRLQRARELCGIREKNYELTEQIAAMRNTLTQYELSDADTIRSKMAELQERQCNLRKSIEENEDLNDEDKKTLERLEGAFLKINGIEASKQEKASLEMQSATLDRDISTMQDNLSKAADYASNIAEIKKQRSVYEVDYKVHVEASTKLARKIAEMKAAKAQYEETINRQMLVRDVLDAVSAKKGIPLIFVKLFLAECKDSLNDLISDVFEDSIEIQDFDIPEDSNEFNIPYTRNGVYIDDINKASQGERAIISLALSFALIRQRSFNYNIMLLDEVDGPLHKSVRDKFIAILFKQIHDINAEQVFLVSHNNTFDGFNVNVILTGDDIIDKNPLTSVMHV